VYIYICICIYISIYISIYIYIYCETNINICVCTGGGKGRANLLCQAADCNNKHVSAKQMRQHTSAYVRIRQNTSESTCECQETNACLSSNLERHGDVCVCVCIHTICIYIIFYIYIYMANLETHGHVRQQVRESQLLNILAAVAAVACSVAAVLQSVSHSS
jgi:hypothetical protein